MLCRRHCRCTGPSARRVKSLARITLGASPEQRSHGARRFSDTAAPTLRLPPGAWDTHMHVVEPQRYPLVRGAAYQPATHTLDDALQFESSLGIEHLVLVQPSVYGTDNSCLLHALHRIGPQRSRGVVVIDPATTSPTTLARWHRAGVRGVRINLQSVGQVLPAPDLARTLRQHAALIRPLGWILQVYLALDAMPLLEPVVPLLGVPLCVDHFGCPPGGELPSVESLPGFASLVALLRARHAYVKLSAPYRFAPHLAQLEAMARAFLRVAPDRVVYATDWPHTRFPGADIMPFTQVVLRLCAEQPGLAERVFRENAREMMDGRC